MGELLSGTCKYACTIGPELRWLSIATTHEVSEVQKHCKYFCFTWLSVADLNEAGFILEPLLLSLGDSVLKAHLHGSNLRALECAIS